MRWIVVLVIDGLLALPRLAFTLAVYFWMRVLGADDPDLARRVVLWVILANTVKL